MSKSGKKFLQAKETLSIPTPTSGKDALESVVKLAYAKFDESVDVNIVLGIDPTKGDQTVRGSVLLPHGTGKQVRVAAFVKGDNEEVAKNAGADFVGADDLIKKIQDGWMDFDAAVATPDLMGLVGKVARVLGPRGLLPNKKIGTVTSDIGPIVSDLKKGRVSFRNDKGGVLHAPFGKVSFGVDTLIENLVSLVKAVKASKPASSKGRFIRKITVSSSMGVGVAVNPDDLV
jgi:large subunit ribosomal protein L1